MSVFFFFKDQSQILILFCVFFFPSAEYSKIKRSNNWTLSFVAMGKQDRKVWAKCKGNLTCPRGIGVGGGGTRMEIGTDAGGETESTTAQQPLVSPICKVINL